METDDFRKFDGPAEADTTYVGGKAANMHKRRRAKVIRGRGTVGKTAVHGVLQRVVQEDGSLHPCNKPEAFMHYSRRRAEEVSK